MSLSNEASRLRRIWSSVVADMTGNRLDKRHLSRKYEPSFEKAAEALSKHSKVDWREFCEAQIYWLMQNNVPGILSPYLLSGGKAWGRFRSYPRKEKRLKSLKHEYEVQEEAFGNYMHTFHGDVATVLSIPTADFSPVFIYLVRKSYGLPIEDTDIERAKRELVARPLVAEVVEESVVKELQNA